MRQFTLETFFYMKRLFIASLFIFLTGILHSSNNKQHRILVFSKTLGYHHNSIAAGNIAIIKLGMENGFAVDTTTDASLFTSKNLRKYNAVIFLSTTGDVLNDEQQKAFETYVKHGGGFAGIHAATDTEYDWPWYNNLVGAYFKSHPKQQNAVLHVTDTTFVATKGLPAEWKRWDEWYNFKSLQLEGLHILLTIDEKSYTGGENGDFHPMSWYHDFDGGRAFYTELGHTDEAFSEPFFLQHLLGGINYAIGK